jgi:type I restriction enzyme S subunit
VSKGQNTPGIARRRFRPYPEYKDSGIEWLGKIPAHWEVKRIKNVARLHTGGTPPGLLDEAFEEEGIPWVKPEQLQGDCGIVVPDRRLSYDAAKSLGIVIAGSTLVCGIGTVGKSGHAPFDVCTNQQINAITFGPKVINRYGQFMAVCLEQEFVRRANKVTIAICNKSGMGEATICIPQAEEQISIASLLDHETAMIDALIEKKERLIELLQEKRTVLITQAVTKGLNPSVPMKDPGVEWIDQIPVHWIGLSLKRWVKIKITDGPHETPALEDEGVDFISAEAVSNGKIDFDHRRGFISQALHKLYCRKCKPVRDDILLCKSGATTGKLAMVEVDFDFSVWSPLALIRADTSTILPKFLALALDSNYVQEQIIRTWSAGTQPNISMGDLEKLFVIAPSIEEQHQILKHLNCQIGGFDAMMEKIREAIDLLKEYRSTLISAAVTGKIDAREIVRFNNHISPLD